ncbi:MAG: hypothetical protein LAO19_07210 [Acidobacteriia bacterium]|nr:hypothetical protein [Terriglobia bacterium]
MSTSRSAKETLAHYIDAMGQELGQVFHATSNELTWIHWRWSQFCTLFGQDESLMHVLNEAAPFFFRIIHDVLFEDTMLAIARITGPPATFSKANLAITKFPELIVRSDLKARISELVIAAQGSATFARDWRNRHLAHRDLDLAVLNPKVQPLATVTRNHVDNALSALRDVLNFVEESYCKEHTAYSHCSVPGDARELLYIINSGLSHERDRRARWREKS